jgi:deazaflavin-dependent oxidoreductase (nitroreductase family)
MRIQPPNKKFSEAYRKFLYLPMGRLVLLLTTTGRKTGNLHTIGLQYEFINGRYYVGAADGERADWYRNILKEPRVKIQVGKHRYEAIAIAETETEKASDFLQYRLKKHPLMIRAIMRMDGFKGRIEGDAIRQYAAKIKVVTITPVRLQG